jgi:MraZ protein
VWSANVLLGLFEQRLDEKNRVTIPVKLREHLDQGAVITRGFDGCLAVFDVAAWQTFRDDQLGRFDQLTVEGRQMRRQFENNASRAELDAQGRVGIPAHLAAHARLGRDVVVAGSGDRIEIWDRDVYRQSMASIEGRVEGVAERVASESGR